jgi:hypothetical protein
MCAYLRVAAVDWTARELASLQCFAGSTALWRASSGVISTRILTPVRVLHKLGARPGVRAGTRRFDRVVGTLRRAVHGFAARRIESYFAAAHSATADIISPLQGVVGTLRRAVHGFAARRIESYFAAACSATADIVSPLQGKCDGKVVVGLCGVIFIPGHMSPGFGLHYVFALGGALGVALG